MMRAAQEKRKLFLRCVRNIAKKLTYVYIGLGLYACDKIYNI